MIQKQSSWLLPEAGETWPPWPGEPVDTGKFELFVRSVGEPHSPPALFVHGLGGSSSNWTNLMGLLSGRFHARAVDLPGFGCSEPPPGFRYTLDEHVEAVVGLISSSGGDPVHLFGNSMGGAIATRIAAENPELVRALTLISPALPTLRPYGNNALVGALAVPGLGTRLMARLHHQPADELIADVMNRVVYDAGQAPARRTEEAIQELEQMRNHSWGDEALIQSTRGLISVYLVRGPRSLWRQAASVEAPTLLIWGRHDKLVSPSLAGSTASVFPHNRLLLLEDAGHVAQIERPLVVANAVFGLLDDLEPDHRP